MLFASAICFQNLVFQKKKSFRNTTRVSNSYDLERAQHFDGPNLGPNCMYKLTADNTSRQRVNEGQGHRQETSHH